MHASFNCLHTLLLWLSQSFFVGATECAMEGVTASDLIWVKDGTDDTIECFVDGTLEEAKGITEGDIDGATGNGVDDSI